MATSASMERDTTPDAERSPLEHTLACVGDRWTLLLVDALQSGAQRFGDLLDAFEGLAPNVLSRRLKQLEADGLVVAQPYSDRPRRHRYALTASGRELAGALRLLTEWGARREPAAAADHVPLHHQACGTAVEARWYCPTCHRLVDDDEAADLRYL
jgi:DNA-binding HxlR family transcriptional regulator